MTALVLALLTVAPPPVLVVRRETVGVSEPVVATVLRGVADGLTLEGLAAGEAKPACGGDAACLAQTAADAHAAAAMGVTVVKTRKGLSVDLEAIAADARALGVATFPVPASGAPFPPEAIAFLNKLARALAPKEEDAPKLVELAPAPQKGPAPVEAVHATARRPLLRPLVVGTAIVGVAALGLGLAGGLYANDLKARFTAGRFINETRMQAQSEAALANGLVTGALISALVAAAAGVTGLIVWATDPDGAEAD